MADVQVRPATGSTAYGKAAVEALVNEEHKTSTLSTHQVSSEDVQLVLQSFRLHTKRCRLHALLRVDLPFFTCLFAILSGSLSVKSLRSFFLSPDLIDSLVLLRTLLTT